MSEFGGLQKHKQTQHALRNNSWAGASYHMRRFEPWWPCELRLLKFFIHAFIILCYEWCIYTFLFLFFNIFFTLLTFPQHNGRGGRPVCAGETLADGIQTCNRFWYVGTARGSHRCLPEVMMEVVSVDQMAALEPVCLVCLNVHLYCAAFSVYRNLRPITRRSA